jgi:hypothetical protein
LCPAPPNFGESFGTLATPASSSPNTVVPQMPFLPPIVGKDDAPTKRSRKATAVLLLGTKAIQEDKGLRFLPVLCVIDGKLSGGIDCGKAMPPTVRVRTTRAHQAMPSLVWLSQTKQNFKDKSGDQTFVAPEGPVCCSYNSCSRATIPYFAGLGTTLPEANVLAVWPADAEIGLEPQSLEVDPNDVYDGSWNREPVEYHRRLIQSVHHGKQRMVSLRSSVRGGTDGVLAVDNGSGWGGRLLPPGVMEYQVFSLSDMDEDGNAEAIVFEYYTNDFGLKIFGNDWHKPAIYQESCGTAG